MGRPERRYVHMFETLLATSRPWLYLHVLLPGRGVANLVKPEFALPGLGDGHVASKAAVDGTLMRVVAYQRQPDQCLRVAVQGVGRGVVLRGTQAAPYARAHVLALPDDEALQEAHSIVQRRAAMQGLSEDGDDGMRLRAVAAAAAAEDGAWHAYEYRAVELRSRLPPAFVSFDPDAVARCAQAAQRLSAPARDPPPRVAASPEGDWLYVQCERHVRAALSTGAEGSGGLRAALSEGAESEAAGPGPSGPGPAETADSAAEGSAAEGSVDAADAVAAEAAQQLKTLEVQTWLELDAFLRAIEKRNGALPVPAQLLGLLPPPPRAGWPSEFALPRLVNELRKQAAAQRAMDLMDVRDDPEPYVPASEARDHRPNPRTTPRHPTSMAEAHTAAWTDAWCTALCAVSCPVYCSCCRRGGASSASPTPSGR